MWCDLWEKAQTMLQRQIHHDVLDIQTKSNILLITFKHAEVISSVSVILNTLDLTYQESDDHLPFSYKLNENKLIIDFLERFKIISSKMADKMNEEFSLPITPHHAKTL